jgi:hypothetical protein
VQTAQEVQDGMEANYPRSRALAWHLYARWLEQIA